MAEARYAIYRADDQLEGGGQFRVELTAEQAALGAMTDGEVAWIINLRHGVFDELRRIGVTDERLIALLGENGLWPPEVQA